MGRVVFEANPFEKACSTPLASQLLFAACTHHSVAEFSFGSHLRILNHPFVSYELLFDLPSNHQIEEVFPPIIYHK